MRRAIAAVAVALALASSACVTKQDGAPAVTRAGGEQRNASTQLAHVEADYQACRAIALASAAATERSSGPGIASSMLPLRRRAVTEASSEDRDLSFQQPYEHGLISAHGRDVAQAAMRRCMIRRGYMLNSGSPA
jgi:hypothetical protein